MTLIEAVRLKASNENHNTENARVLMEYINAMTNMELLQFLSRANEMRMPLK